MPVEHSQVAIIDPAYGQTAGHHHELNAQLLKQLELHRFTGTVWADQTAATGAAVCGVFSEVGYLPLGEWDGLARSQLQAGQVQLQLQRAADASPPVDIWLVHSLLPFHLLGFARFLARQPAAVVIISLMFDPQDGLLAPLHGPYPERTCAVALLELSRACRNAGHRLVIGACSRHTLERSRHLMKQARLPEPQLHPAVVGAGCQVSAPGPDAIPMVLLHWGDLKPDKGRAEALAVVQALLAGWQPPLASRFVFHSYSHLALEPEEAALLHRAQKLLGERFLWLQHQVPSAEMLQLLASCDLALLPYCPSRYAHRSSGVLWCYAAARYTAGLPAAALGYGGHWLQEEAQSWGMAWQTVDPARPVDLAPWQNGISQALMEAPKRQAAWTPYASAVLGRSFADWVLEQLAA